MRMNRRNVLFVLGTTILLGGRLIGTGAFSQVEATRDVTVETTGDGSAALGLALNENVADDHVNNSSNGEAIEIQFNNVNNDSNIYYDELLNVTNNGGQDVSLNVSTSGNGIMVYDGNTPNSFDSGNTVNVTSVSDTESFGIAVNTTAYDSGNDNTIKIEATT